MQGTKRQNMRRWMKGANLIAHLALDLALFTDLAQGLAARCAARMCKALSMPD